MYGQLDDVQSTGDEFSPTVQWIPQESIISSRPADRHFPGIDSRDVVKQCAIVDPRKNFFTGTQDIPVRIQLEEVDDLDVPPFDFSAQGDLRFFRKVDDPAFDAQVRDGRRM